ncbi:WD repeat-containing protein 27-like [Bacillus rossius redtenbacheri]|uniref:WD repeat-containing protein 27-like n=1 Tax=Bacillus rossius redtenbacheri TaxID=93214 RepID=UPI002FDDBC7C
MSSLDHSHPLTESIPTGVEVGLDLGYIEFCGFSWDNKWLALYKDKELWILKLQFLSSETRASCVVVQSVDTHGVVEVSSSRGSVFTFSSEDNDLLVLVEQSHCFKVLDVLALSVLYQSATVESSPVSCAVFADHKLLLGSSRGMVNIFRVTRSHARLVAKFDVTRSFQQDRAAGVENDPKGYALLAEDQETACDIEELGCIVSSLRVFNRASVSVSLESTDEDFDGREETESLLRSVLQPGPVLVVGCNVGIALYDVKTQDCLVHIKLAEIFREKLSSRELLPLIDFVVVGGQDLNDVYCVSKMLTGGVKVYMAILFVETNDLSLPNKIITVIPGEPMKLKSPLQCCMPSRKQPSLYSTRSNPSSCSSRGLTKQRSSGYGRPFRMQMFHPSINSHKKHSTASASKVYKSLPDIVDSYASRLMQQQGPPVKLVKQLSVWKPPCTATHLTISGNGKHIACSSNRSDICVLQLDKLDAENGWSLFGHNKQINSLHFSLDSKWMVSSSADGSAKVWDWNHRRCMLNIDNTVGLKHSKKTLSNKNQSLGPVTQARFFYMDQFVLLAERGCLMLVSHTLHGEPLTPQSKSDTVNWKCIRRIDMNTQQVTCFSAANQFHSYLGICGCSSRAIKVFDLNAERPCLELAEAHPRPPHRVVQLEGSPCASHPAAAHDLFLSAAVRDGARLWDLRSARCVQRFSQHSNRSYNSGVDISPCGRYVAASSDDKTVYVYDTRSAEEPLGRLLGLGDVVMDVAFSPLQPVLVALGLNARVVTFCP